ncbi:MAG: 3-methyl-2-oxobutanoate hydroxymethyltransferase [Candidatus Abyssobacteria bacterium SURF_17]|uniref:3-methyl-2-oxobutanoate hydroxymethyltransferase n=1 Tax=Candidatus Abyssobacteria bacterium SURF_17 TaxID=2093361 RepID=A0A419F7H5_9BACT|nr:MAG: 3-methyl-2-oxobutanoate hydroxymethyltransferase [Candidatus Abyssubacteria bacterium SURF_17]
MPRTKITVPDIIQKKQRREKITMLTAYDFPMASILSKAGVDMLLVGDSANMVVAGEPNSLTATMEQMIYHTRIVANALPVSLVVGDMPFMSYQLSSQQAAENAGRFVSEGKAEAVKLEGGAEFIKEIEAILRCGIPVMGHLGLTPQSVHKFGGFKVQGRDEAAAKKLMDDALAMQDAGVFSIVLECVPAELAKKMTESLDIPTIGIGAGPDCDGQVLVTPDLLGLFERFTPKFVKRYAHLAPLIEEAVKTYIDEVKTGKFPSEEHIYK